MCKQRISNANFGRGWACMQNHMAFSWSSPSPKVNPSHDRWQLNVLKTAAAGAAVIDTVQAAAYSSAITLAGLAPGKAVHPLENSTHDSHTQHKYSVDQLRSTSLHSRKGQGSNQGSLRNVHKVGMRLLQWHWRQPSA
jgi:hypothetical protein